LPYLTSGHACTLQQKQPLKPILIFLTPEGAKTYRHENVSEKLPGVSIKFEIGSWF